jgi:hypothetical protein
VAWQGGPLLSPRRKQMKKPAWKRKPGRRHAQIHLPALDPDEAVLVVELLERVIRGIWRAHGDAMADFLGRVDPDSDLMVQPYDAELARSDNPGHDDF